METEAPLAQQEPEVYSRLYPELGDRYKSITVDLLVIIALMFAAGYLFEAWTSAPESARILAFIIIWAGYEPIATSLGCTLGNYVMKIRVRRSSDESRRINVLQAYVRYIVKVLLGWLIFLSMGANPRRRGIHDLAASSVMVRLNEVPNRNKELVG
ncbi:MAG: RDD family protein [Flavobacteriales bacterium]|nr:RDD family protein [Flavobacteriales bacterium]